MPVVSMSAFGGKADITRTLDNCRGVELANGSELERALAPLITKRRSHRTPMSAVEWPFFYPPP